MAVIYSTTVKNARHAATISEMGASAKLEIGTAGMATVLAVIMFDNPAGTVSGGTLTFAGFPKSDVSADASGTAAAARIRKADNSDIVTGLTVGTSGTDIVLGSVVITEGQTITITSATIVHG